jgi:hypothetical protein
MEVRRIGSSRADRRRFVSFPHRLYRDEPFWVPPMRSDEMRALDRHHPFYRHSEAAFFVVEDEGEIVGRIGVFEHRPANEFHGSTAAFFGYFESVADPAVAGALTETAEVWARDRGLDTLIGPKGLLPSDGHGILVDGFDHPAVLGVGYNHRYYDDLLHGVGFESAADYLSGQLDVSHEIPDQVFALADAAMAEGGYTLKTFTTKRQLRPWILQLGRMYNDAMSSNWEYVPVDEVEIEAMAQQLLPVADPRLIALLMHDDDVAGYLLIIPDISDALRACRGRLLPLGWARVLREIRTTTRVNILAMGLVPEHRGVGANLIIYSALARGAQQHRFEGAEVVQVETGNTPMMRNLETLGVPWTKRHRMYRRSL